MSFSRTLFSLFQVILTFQSPLPALLAIITQDSKRSCYNKRKGADIYDDKYGTPVYNFLNKKIQIHLFVV